MRQYYITFLIFVTVPILYLCLNTDLLYTYSDETFNGNEMSLGKPSKRIFRSRLRGSQTQKSI